MIFVPGHSVSPSVGCPQVTSLTSFLAMISMLNEKPSANPPPSICFFVFFYYKSTFFNRKSTFFNRKSTFVLLKSHRWHQVHRCFCYKISHFSIRNQDSSTGNHSSSNINQVTLLHIHSKLTCRCLERFLTVPMVGHRRHKLNEFIVFNTQLLVCNTEFSSFILTAKKAPSADTLPEAFII